MTAAAKIMMGLAAVALGLAIYTDFAVGFWGDQDWELLVSRMWLGGKKLYVDHVPVTAPLLFYLYALPVRLSQLMPFLQDYQVLVLLGLLAAAATILLCTRLIARHPAFASRHARLRFVMLLAFLLVFRISPSFFGDREHILIVLTLPYLLRWMPGLREAALPLRLRLSIGAMAAIGYFIKPHCLLLFAAIQLVTILRTRSFAILHSPENIVIYGFGMLYGFIVWHYTPQYLTLVLPIAWFTYSAIRGYPGGMYGLMLSAALTFMLLRPRDSSPYRRDIYYFAMLLPFYFLYARINDGWAYAYQPLITLLLLANGFVLLEFLYLQRTLALEVLRPRIGAALCLVNFAIEVTITLHYIGDIVMFPCRGNSACPGYYQPFINELKAPPQARSFGAIGMDFILWTRVARLSGAEWNTRFPQLWMMPRLYIADDDFYHAHLGIFYYAGNALADDLERNKPDIVFVEVSNTFYSIQMEKTVNWIEDFSTIPDFRNAWKNYTFAHSITDCPRLQPYQEIGLKEPRVGTELLPKLKRPPCHYDVYRRLPEKSLRP